MSKFSLKKLVPQVKKWEGGAEKHGGLVNSMGVQAGKWLPGYKEQARELEELRQRRENERLAKEAAAERERLEQEQIRRALELSKKAEEELAAQKLAKEAEELRQRLENERLTREAEELRQRLENERLAKEVAELRQRLENERLAKEAAAERERLEQEQIKQAEELEQLRLAEKLSKESFEKSQRGKIINFLRSPDDVSDDVALPALDIVKRWESTNEELIEKLHDFGNEALDKFLSSVEIAGDSSF